MDKIGFIDIGARGGTAARLQPFHAQLDRVLVEPEAKEAERLIKLSDNGQRYSVISEALGHVDGDIDLFVVRNPTCTSALKVNYDFVQRYGLRGHFEFQEKIKIKCSRYDTLFAGGGLPIPHAVKIDVQGFEYQVLEGFGKLLNDCLALEIETHFYPLYSEQRTIGEMVRFLSTFGFSLRSISNSRSPDLRGDKHFDGDLVEVDASFSKNRAWLAGKGSDVRNNFKLACAVLDIDVYNGI